MLRGRRAHRRPCRSANCAQRMQLQQAPQVAQRLAQVRAQQSRQPGFLPESSAELATAGLVQRLETVVAAGQPRQPQLRDHQPLAADRTAPRALRARGRAGAPALRQPGAGRGAACAGKRRAAPVRRQPQHPVAQRYFFCRGHGQPGGDGGLDVSFDLYGYLRRRAPRRDAEVTRARLTTPARAPGCSATVAGWALLVWLLALFGMGGTHRRWPTTRACCSALPQPRARGAPNASARCAQYARDRRAPAVLRGSPAASRSSCKRPRAKASRADLRFRADQRADHAAACSMAILQPADGSESVRVKLGEAPEVASGLAPDRRSMPRSAVFERPARASATMELRVFDGHGGQPPTALNAPPRRACATGGHARRRPRPATPPHRRPAPTRPAAASAATPAAPPTRSAAASAACRRPATTMRPMTPEAQMEAIRKRIEARRAQLRAAAATAATPGQDVE